MILNLIISKYLHTSSNPFTTDLQLYTFNPLIQKNISTTLNINQYYTKCSVFEYTCFLFIVLNLAEYKYICRKYSLFSLTLQ
mgnify:FL=1